MIVLGVCAVGVLALMVVDAPELLLSYFGGVSLDLVSCNHKCQP